MVHVDCGRKQVEVYFMQSRDNRYVPFVYPQCALSIPANLVGNLGIGMRVCTDSGPQLTSYTSIVTPEYFCNLDANFMRLDHAQRPELNKGTVDFAVPEAYWSPHPNTKISRSYFSIEPPPETPTRRPEPMRFLFAFDVTMEAVKSGFLHAACTSLRTVLFGGEATDGTPIPSCFPSECTVGILTFDSSLHFYDLSVCSYVWTSVIF
jgi:Sec23/Sec24 trunk domain